MGEKHKHVETKQHSIQKPMSQRWNQKENQKKKKTWDKWKWKHNFPQSIGCSKTNSNRDYSTTAYLKKQTEIPNKQPYLLSKGTRKRTKPNIIRKKEIIKIREEINEIQTKK